ncbi:hypothetical protein DFJ74DRAFT_684991 [Hyaloraphidium curvatum]|nr:hypothetical protein DFJ74DRAFT_684991 [Hyaloraphidium curvatum]
MLVGTRAGVPGGRISLTASPRQIRFNFYPTGRYAARIGTQPNNQSFPPPMALTISCEFGPGVPFSPGNAAQYEFLAGAPPPLVTVPAPIYGPNDMFPFDTHNIELGIRCWQGSAVEGTVTEVPIYVELIGVVQSWRFALTTLHNPTYTRWTADIYASRSPTTVFFAIFIMILMWCLAMSMAYMFYYYSFRAPRGRMPADLLSVGPTIVFALPFVREAVPGTPPAGVLSDYIAYFWCEAIVVITTVGLIAVWFLRHQAPFHANWRWRSSAPADMEMVYKGQSAVLSLDNLEREPIGSNEDAEGHALHEDAEGHALPPDAEAHNLHED